MSKTNRRSEIMQACRQLYETTDFRDITIKSIAELTSFTRPSIYNYFQTKEEIFLAILQEEYESWNASLQTLLLDPDLDKESLAQGLARSVADHPQLLRLMTMNNYDMEAGSRMEALVTFKKAYGNSLRLVDGLAARACPQWSAQRRSQFVYAFFPFMYGIYPYVEVRPNQAQAMEKAETGFKSHSIYELTLGCVRQLLGDA